jgi:hypothetical protein
VNSIISISSDLRCHPIADEAVLFDERSRELFLLNPTAAFIWTEISRGITPGDIASAIAEATGMKRATIMNDVGKLVQEWQALALSDDESHSAPASEPMPRPCPTRRGTGKRYALRSDYYALGELTFRICSDHAVAINLAQSMFAHLSTVACGSDPLDIALERNDEVWRIMVGGHAVNDGKADALAPLLHGETLLQAHLHTSAFATFHAAVLSRRDRCILLPGAPGSGKTTLAVASAQAGLDYCSDEIAVMDADMRVHPFAVNAGLKEGAWPVLTRRLPEIESLPIWRRGDGQRVKYWCPPTPQAWQATKDVAALVFPRYQNQAPCQLEKLSPGQALCDLTAAGFDTKLLDDPWVASTAEWITGVPSYRLTYGDLESARDELENIL